MHVNLRRPRALAATLLAGLAVAAIPATAGAQSLQSVAITTSSSGGMLALDVSGASINNGAGIIQWVGNFSGDQRWNFVDQGDGTEEIVNQNSGKCLTTDGVDGDQLYQVTCLGLPLQKWAGTLNQAFGASGRLKNPYTNLYAAVNNNTPWAGAAIVGSSRNSADILGYYQLY